MKKFLLSIAIAFFANFAFAANPVASLTASRTYGSAPVCVHFDATASTDADTSYPFRDLLYKWNFGDPGVAGSNVWETGANTSWPKNLARGPVAAHCYETPGTYTATLQVCDATRCSTATHTVRVDNPEVDNSGLSPAGSNFTGANTYCFANVQAVAGVGGCPSGATIPAGTSDFDAAITTCLASGKRCLFKKGDTFTASAQSTLSTAITTAVLGSYGAGDYPRIEGASLDFIYTAAAITDLVIKEIDFYGAGEATTQGSIIKFDSDTTNITVLRVGCYDHGGCYTTKGNADTNRATGLFVVENRGLRWSKGNFTYMAIKKGAFMGNFLDEIKRGAFTDPLGAACALCTAEHGFRFQYAFKTVISHNYFGNAAAYNKHQLTVRGPPRNNVCGTSECEDRDSAYNIVSNNYFDNTSRSKEQVSLAPAGTTQCHWIRDIIVERNFFTSSSLNVGTIRLEGQRMAIRNNVFIQAVGAGEAAIQVLSENDDTCVGDSYDMINTDNILPQRQKFFIENNSVYAVNAANNFNPIAIYGSDHSVINNEVSNNLAYSSTCCTDVINGFHNPYEEGTTTNTVKATNTVFAQVTTSPWSSSPSTAVGFRPPSTSYAATGATYKFPVMVEDFYLCKDKTSGTARMGAMVPASRAQCVGVAQ